MAAPHPSPPAHRLPLHEARRRPLLLYIVDHQDGKPIDAGWRRLLGDPRIIEFDIDIRRVDSSRKAEFSGLLKGEAQDDARTQGWLIVLPNGEKGTSGPGLPQPEVLLAAFEAAGAKPLLIPLRRFVQAHPSHVPARLKLMDELVSVSLRISALNSGDTPEALSRDRWEQDELGSHFKHLIQTADWPSVAWRIQGILKRIRSGSESPALKSAFESCLPRLREACLSAPTEEGALSLNLHVSEVLGRDLDLGFLFTSVWFGHPGRPYEVPDQIPRLLVKAARKSGQWRDTLDLLRRFCEESYLPGLQRTTITGDGQVRLDRISASRARAWQRFGEPLVEAMIHCDREVELVEWLGGLDESWSTVQPYEQTARLAAKMGQGDLAARLRRLAVRSYRQAPPGINFDRPVLFHDGSHPGLVSQVVARLQGVEGFLLQLRKADPPWSDFLAWNQGRKKWSLVGLNGREVVYSTQWLPEEEMFATIHASGLTPPRVEAKGFLAVHPDHREALHFLAESCLNEAFEVMWSSPAPPSTRPGFDRMARLESLVEDYAEASERLLNTSYGKALALRKGFHPNLPDLCRVSKVTQRIEALAGKVIPILETELTSFPNDTSLWENWISLKACTKGNLDFAFCSFPEQRPLGLGPVPPYGVWHKVIALCQERKAWADLNAFMLPRLEEELTFSKDPSNNASRQNLSQGIQVLVPSMIQSGRTEDLAAFLTRCLAAGIRGLKLDRAVTHCKEENHSSIVSLLESISSLETR